MKHNYFNEDDEMVTHPPHYQSETGLEVIDVIEAFTFDLTGIEATDTGNIIKYICRWKNKNGLQDLKKAKWYLEHLIKHVENLEEENKFANPSFKVTAGIGISPDVEAKVIQGINDLETGFTYCTSKGEN